MRWILICLMGFPMMGWCGTGPLAEVEVTPQEITDAWWQDYTIRLRPAETGAYEDIVFECVLHQEFPWTNADGKESTKIFEPAAFTYKRHDVKLVPDLDCFISFKVPSGMEHLKQMYGDKTFKADVPVTISVVKITAMNGGKKVWKTQVPPAGVTVPVVTLSGNGATNAPAVTTNAPSKKVSSPAPGRK